MQDLPGRKPPLTFGTPGLPIVGPDGTLIGTHAFLCTDPYTDQSHIPRHHPHQTQPARGEDRMNPDTNATALAVDDASVAVAEARAAVGQAILEGRIADADARSRLAAGIAVVGPITKGSIVVVPDSLINWETTEDPDGGIANLIALFVKAAGHKDFVLLSYDETMGQPVTVFGRDELKALISEAMEDTP